MWCYFFLSGECIKTYIKFSCSEKLYPTFWCPAMLSLGIIWFQNKHNTTQQREQNLYAFY